ncbi:hypothetical protein [Chryseobacterium wanjuense]
MSPLPELNLNLRISKNHHEVSHAKREGEIIVRTDSVLKKHTIRMAISDQEVGKVHLKIGKRMVEIPTYKMTVTDDKTNETEVYQVTRDTLRFVKSSTRKNILSFLGFKKFDKTSFLYENIAFEPKVETIEKFILARYRNLSEESLVYNLSGNNQNIILYAGNVNDFKEMENVSQYFIVIDQNEGKSFIGDIAYREKVFKAYSSCRITYC